MSATSSSTNPVNSQNETTVVDEIPEALNEILLMVVKNFFSNEHYLVVYYIMRAECIREENLRARLCFDQKQIRQLLATLKAEKLVKERLFSQKNENNRNVSIIFYFINYRAVLNVLKYKIDHMRQKLESREKNDTNKAHYKCTNCQSTYDMLDVTGIMDMATGKLICWRCHAEVVTDESAAPSNMSRTAVARFNEQMGPLFNRIQSLSKIQLAPHLLEPDINKYLEDDKALEQLLQQQLDFTSNGGRTGLGGVAHSYNAATLNYQNGDQITVDLNADINNRPVDEAKQMPLWLQDNAIGGSTNADASHNEKILSQVSSESTPAPEKEKGLSINLLAEFEGVSENAEKEKEIEEPAAKKAKTDEEEAEDEEEFEDEEMVQVGGASIPLSEVTPEIVEKMTDDEREKYTELIQQYHMY